MVRPEGPLSTLSTGRLLELELDRRSPPGRQLERRLRELIRSRALELGARLPSTRSLATELGVLRGVVVGVYAQLAAEGYLAFRRGASPTVVARGHDPRPIRREPDVPVARARFNLRPDRPVLALFPRGEWIAASRASLGRAADTDLAYGAPFGSVELRERLASFLARTRGIAADSERTNIFAGFARALFVVASVLRERGATRIAVPDPSHRWRARTLGRSGLELVSVPVDRNGLQVDALPDVQAVVVSPDHEYPLGAVRSPERRRALVDWAVARGCRRTRGRVSPARGAVPAPRILDVIQVRIVRRK